MKGIIDEYADAKAAARNRVLADERLKLVSEIVRLRAALLRIKNIDKSEVETMKALARIALETS